MEPNTLLAKWTDRPTEIIRAGANFANLCDKALFNTRHPSGHPEGFIEAFANIYRNFALAIRCRLNGEEPRPEYLDFPTVEDGVRGMRFITKVVESAKSDRKWIKFQ